METIRNLQNAPLDVQDLIKTFIGNHHVSQVTDIHIRENGTVAARIKDLLVPAKNWGDLTDDNGVLKTPNTFRDIGEALFAEHRQERSSVVFRGKSHQIRCHQIQSVNAKKIFVRVQPLAPPSLSLLLKDNPLTLERIAQASGLVLVCGPVGGGKTTTAASIVSYWATKQSWHIATIEDPVEFDLRVPAGDITSIQGNLFDAAANDRGHQAQKLIRETLRCDINGLFIGEVRDFESRSLCLAFASTREPVVTTIHTGGFSDAIMRMTDTDQHGMDHSTMRMLLARCLHTIIYVDLAYTEKGEAVPVILALPGGVGSLRNAIAEGPVRNLKPAFAHAIMSVSDAEGGISPLRAIATARQRGATAASIRAALPPDVSEEMLSHAKLS